MIQITQAEYARLKDKETELEVLLEQINFPEVRNFLDGVEVIGRESRVFEPLPLRQLRHGIRHEP